MIGANRRIVPIKNSDRYRTKKTTKVYPESARPARKPPDRSRNQRKTLNTRNNTAARSNYSCGVYSSPSVSSYSESETDTSSESATSISLTSASSASSVTESESSSESDSTESTISSRTANYTLAKYLDCYDRMYKRGDLKMLNNYEYIPRQPSVSLSRERIVSHSPKISSLSRQRIVSHSPKMSTQKSTLTTRGESSQAKDTMSTSFLAHSGIRNEVDLVPLACEDVRGDQTGVQAPKVKVGFRLPPLTAVSGDMKVNQLRRNRNVAELNKRKFRLPDVYAKIYGNNAKTGRDKYTVWENYRMKIKSDTHIKNDK